MKLTKRQLRKLIREAVYEFGKLPRTVDYEMKRLNREIERSNARIDSMLSQRQKDNLAVFDEDDPDYAEEFRLGLDPDRPEIIRLRQTFETVSVRKLGHLDAAPSGHVEIEIPQELVNDVIDTHLRAQTGGSRLSRAAQDFRQAAIRVRRHIGREIQRKLPGQRMGVYEYGLSTRGARADEYARACDRDWETPV